MAKSTNKPKKEAAGKSSSRKSKPLPKSNIDMKSAGGKALMKQMADAPVGKSDYFHNTVNEIVDLENQKKAIADIIKAKCVDVKRNGFSVKATKHVVKLCRMDKDEAVRQELDVAIAKQAYGFELTEQQELALEEQNGKKDAAPDPDAVAASRSKGTNGNGGNGHGPDDESEEGEGGEGDEGEEKEEKAASSERAQRVSSERFASIHH